MYIYIYIYNELSTHFLCSFCISMRGLPPGPSNFANGRTPCYPAYA